MSETQTAERVAVLDQLGIMDTAPERAFDDIVQLAARLCDVPIAAVSLLDADRNWFKAKVGLAGDEVPIGQSLCQHPTTENAFIEIADVAADPRTRDNPIVMSDGLRFYAGAVLRTPDGVPLGALCVIDRQPRELTELQRDALRVLSDQVTNQLELRAALARQEVLLGEVDHRVKNSLQSVSAVVQLQARRSVDPAVRDALATVAQRVETVAAIHKELHGASNGDTVDLAALFGRVGGLFSTAAPPNVTITARFDPLTVGSTDAHSVAVLCNEFVANAIKHGFPDGGAGAVTLSGERVEAGYRITCTDNGVGDEAALAAMEGSSGLGTRLMRAAAQSLRAESTWSTDGQGLILTVLLPER